MAGSTAFVGREDELSRLLEALGGAARLVLVAGDAGVGKTQFTEEGMARAEAGGLVAVRGECLPLGRALPLMPWAAALGELGRLEGGDLLSLALDAAPDYVRGELGQLLPQFGTGSKTNTGERWQRERLFSAVAELLSAVARERPVGVVIEDVHWADSATLDLVTFLARPGGPGGVRVVATCRSDDARVGVHVADWMAYVRGRGGVVEVRLGPLSRAEVAEQVAALANGPIPPGLVEDLYARAEGNPFFTEQMVAAAMARPEHGLRVPPGLPARLSELLTMRAGRCGQAAGAVLAALAIAGRPLGEDLLCSVSGLSVEAVRDGLRELAASRLLADDHDGGMYRARHVLLAEAVAAGLLSGERGMLHERVARALRESGGDALAGEAAGHWQAAGRPDEELPVRVVAAIAAERAFGYAEAAEHWVRAIDLCRAQPSVPGVAGIDVPRMYVRAVDTLHQRGDRGRAGELAEVAYRLFADHPDKVTAAIIHMRAGAIREFRSPHEAKPLLEKALRLFEHAPPSADHAEAWSRYATFILFHAEGRLQESRTALNRALDIADAAGADDMTARILSWLAVNAFLLGRVDEGFSCLRRASAAAETSGNKLASLWLAATRSDALMTLGRFGDAVDVAEEYRADIGPTSGTHDVLAAAFLAASAAEALLAMGRTAEAAELIDPLTAGPARRETWGIHQRRAQIDLLRGLTDAAAARQRQISSFSFAGSIDNSRRLAQDAAELALWAGRPADAFREVQRGLALFKAPDLTVLCGRLLVAGMRAAADLADQGRARRDIAAARAALDGAADLAAWADAMGSAPFADHPFVAAIPAERATWDAERTRVAGRSDATAWAAAAKAWGDLGSPHRAAYAWWRHAEAQLAGSAPAAAAAPALRAAAAAADGHGPLLTQVRALAQRARISLQHNPAVAPEAPGPAGRPTFGLTDRELTVLRLVAGGRTNAQIGAELFISPKTASVHVTSILRKLGVAGRVQAAAVAERAGLLDSSKP